MSKKTVMFPVADNNRETGSQIPNWWQECSPFCQIINYPTIATYCLLVELQLIQGVS